MNWGTNILAYFVDTCYAYGKIKLKQNLKPTVRTVSFEQNLNLVQYSSRSFGDTVFKYIAILYT